MVTFIDSNRNESLWYCTMTILNNNFIPRLIYDYDLIYVGAMNILRPIRPFHKYHHHKFASGQLYLP